MLKKITITVLSLLGAMSIVLLIGFADDVSTPQFVEADGTTTPGSLASVEWITLGGIPQWTLQRARDIDQPILLAIHGGPGAVEAAAYRAFNAELEDHFLVVHWHQRGSGWTMDREAGFGGVNGERIYQDLEELVDALKQKFGREKIYIIGHSWGSILGLRYAYEHPENVTAYVGVGQVSHSRESEKRGCEFVLAAALADKDNAAVNEINSACQFVTDETMAFAAEDMMVQRNYLAAYGGALHGPMGVTDLLRGILGTDEGTLSGLVRTFEGSMGSMETIWPEMMAFDATPWTQFKVPVYFAIGRHDYQVNAALSASYFDTIEAPCKGVNWLENSAHFSLFEEADAFNLFIIDTVKPLKCTPAP